MKTMQWTVTIEEVENGYVARVGCKLLVFTSWEDLSKELTAYAKGEKTELAKELLKDIPICTESCTPEEEPRRELADSLARS